MTKTCKKTLITVFLALFAACLFLFAACTDDKPEDNAVTYTVTVMTDETTPAAGVRVAVRKGGATYESKTTDADGKVEFELVPDSYEIALSSLPAHYSLAADADVSLTAEKRSLTVTLSENFSYKISLVNPDGTPFYAEGVRVGICTLSGNCLSPELLGTDGVARCEAEKGDYHVQILNLPATAAFEKDADGYYTGENFSAEKTEMTITVYPVTSVTAEAPMTDAEKTAYAAKDASYTASDLTAYHVTRKLAAGETAYFSLTPAYDGEFNIYKSAGASYLYNGTAFQKGNNGNGLYAAFPVLAAGTTYYFNVSNTENEEITAEFVVEASAASYSKTVGVGTVNVSITKKGANAVIELTPAIGASFKLTAHGEQLTAFAVCASPYGAKDYTHDAETFVKDAEFSVKFTPNNIGGSLYISVAIKDAASYPADFQIGIEKIADLTNTTTVVEVTEELAVYAKPEGKELKSVPADSESVLVADNKGIYHLNTADGETVFLDIANIAYLEMENPRTKYVLDVTSAEDKTDPMKGNTYKDYRIFLRGFIDYDYEDGMFGPEPVIPSEIATEKYYAKYLNEDGMYPLTTDLLTFLKAFYANNSDYLDFLAPATATVKWMFALYYYDTAATPPSTADVIVGEYENANDGYILAVTEDGKYTLSQQGRTGTEVIETGTWAKTGENAYKFTWTSMNVVYTISRNASTGTLTWVDTEMDEEPYGAFTVKATTPEPTDVIVGDYSGGKNGPALSVKADGTFVIDDGAGKITGTWVKNNDGTYTFTENNAIFGEIPYDVTRDAQTGALTFMDGEDEVYQFAVSSAN